VTRETRYAKSGDVHIAYQVVGDGPIDLVLVPGLFTHVEHRWEEPSFARFLERLASFSRLIVFDARGTGLSDQAPGLPPMEEQMDEFRRCWTQEALVLSARSACVGRWRPTRTRAYGGLTEVEPRALKHEGPS
jgi:pimeloyl-ACP methyl ester carboxylesterase